MRRTALVGFVLVMASSLSLAGLTPEELAALDKLPAADVPIVIRFEGRPLAEVVQAIAATGSFEATIEDNVGDQIVNVNWGKQSLKQALIRLATENDLAYAVPKTSHLVVRKRAKDQ